MKPTDRAIAQSGAGARGDESMLGEDLSEYCVAPELFIVHDPTPFDAFRQFQKITSQAELLTTSLFREQPNAGLLRAQHAAFVDTLRGHVSVAYLADILGASPPSSLASEFSQNPNYVFSHDALVTLPWVPDGFVRASMKQPLRRKEPRLLAKAAEILGLKEILRMPEHLFLEGGDVFPICHSGLRALLLGFGPRTSEQTAFFLRDTLILDGVIDQIIAVRIAPWRLNIDGCFFPVSGNTIVCNPDSVLDGIVIGADYTYPIQPLDFFRELGFSFVEATKDESFFQQACNFACLGSGDLVAYSMTTTINDALRLRGLSIMDVQGSELVKGNGGPHCMTRPIYLR